jgi:hypothetical protein
VTLRLIIARPLPGAVGETKRVCHLFPAPPEDTRPERLAAYCGAEFGPGELELLDRPQGMPCVACLRHAPTPDTDDQPRVSDDGSRD